MKYKKCCGMGIISERRTGGSQNESIPYAMSRAWTDYQSGELESAARQYQSVLKQQPHYADALFHLGLVYLKQAKYADGISVLNRAIKKNSKNDSYYNAIGFAYRELRNPVQAIRFLNQAIKLNPKSGDAYLNRGNALKDLQDLDKALADYNKARSLNPGLILAQTNYLYVLNFSNAYTCKEIADQHMLFGNKYANATRKDGRQHFSKDNPDKRLKIGYVSQDFRQHSVAYFIGPVMKNHDHNLFEVFAYYNNTTVDSTTEMLRGYCDHWRDISGLSDEDLEEKIRQDGIDILVELSGYTANSRVLAFARKLAPLQVAWIGYPNTTGLPAIDYRISDGSADPPGKTEHLYSEKVIRLPECFLCYQPPESSPGVSGPPSIENGYVTFGSFNNLSKVTRQVLEVWSEIIQAVPNSRLLLKSYAFHEEKARAIAMNKLYDAGLAKNRVTLLEWSSSLAGHLDAYSRMDISLDTFPYNGTTTTCEALWMGTPVISLAGECHRSRVGASLLTAAGLGDLICSNEAEYVKKAVQLANDVDRVKLYKANLREILATSSLTNAGRFTAHLENIYRTIWKEWCAQH